MILEMKRVPKPWGVDVLPAPFTGDEADERIGEIWFEPPTAVPELLVKYIFTSKNLSVQVHPSDAQTQAMGLGRQGKEECWLILDAKPGATLGIGMAEEMDASTLRAAAEDGTIEDCLVWHEVTTGDFFYIPANTIHAIGAGISLIEVQQNSDITYRLYDYGRPRELHLDDGLSVAVAGPYAPSLRRHIASTGCVNLVDGPHFRLDRLEGPPDEGVASRYSGPLLLIPQEGNIGMGGGEVVRPGQCALVEDVSLLDVQTDAKFLITQPVSSLC